MGPPTKVARTGRTGSSVSSTKRKGGIPGMPPFTAPINVTALMRLTRAVLPLMLEAGAASVVIVSSEARLRGSAAGAAYTASKHAVNGLGAVAGAHGPGRKLKASGRRREGPAVVLSSMACSRRCGRPNMP